MKRIQAKLKHDFDWIIGLANGGVIPALYLSYETKIKALDTFCVSFYDDKIMRDNKRFFAKDYSHIKDKKVIIVDDLVDTGRSMHFACEYLSQFSPKLIETAVIYKKEHSSFHPDYFLFLSPEDHWITLPWEVPSTYSHIEDCANKG